MPLYRRKNRVIHHIHIPKCGGTSIEDVLVFNDWKRIKMAIPANLSHEIQINASGKDPLYTHHEHRTIWEAWQKEYSITPEFQFAVVRNPYDRFDSKMRQTVYAKQLEKDAMHYPNRVISLLRAASTNPNEFGQGMEDNHYRSQVDFLGEDTFIYKLENHLELLIKDLIKRNIVRSKTQLKKLNSKSHDVFVPWYAAGFEQAHEIFKALYEEDFRALGYAVREWIVDESQQK